MSYEGYVQRICEFGHYWTDDAFEEEDTFCIVHKDHKTIAENHVDLTNCCNDGPEPCRCGARNTVKDHLGKIIGFGDIMVHDFKTPTKRR